jgi:hypothetical protein
MPLILNGGTIKIKGTTINADLTLAAPGKLARWGMRAILSSIPQLPLRYLLQPRIPFPAADLLP